MSFFHQVCQIQVSLLWYPGLRGFGRAGGIVEARVVQLWMAISYLKATEVMHLVYAGPLGEGLP